jgi:hypothetical protein
MSEEEMRKMLSFAFAYLCNIDTLLKDRQRMPEPFFAMIQSQVQSWIEAYKELLSKESEREEKPEQPVKRRSAYKAVEVDVTLWCGTEQDDSYLVNFGAMNPGKARHSIKRYAPGFRSTSTSFCVESTPRRIVERKRSSVRNRQDMDSR